MAKLSELIDFSPGIFAKGKDCDLDLDIPFTEQVNHLDEDMFQVEYPNQYCIDLGWYKFSTNFPFDTYSDEEFDRLAEKMDDLLILEDQWDVFHGVLRIYVIEDCDWENPLLKLEATDAPALLNNMIQAVELVKDRLKQS